MKACLFFNQFSCLAYLFEDKTGSSLQLSFMLLQQVPVNCAQHPTWETQTFTVGLYIERNMFRVGFNVEGDANYGYEHTVMFLPQCPLFLIQCFIMDSVVLNPMDRSATVNHDHL